MKKNSLIYLLSFLCYTSIAQSGVVINELMLSNSTVIADEDGDYPDWIELYNTSASPVNLENFGLSDNEGDLYKWIFPAVSIAPNSYLTIFASLKNRITGPYLHTNFKLSSSGEEVILTDPNSVIQDQISPISVAEDISYGRTTDGGSTMERLYSNTPGASNNIISSIDFSHNSGFYADTIYLSLISNIGDSIFFTTNGADPTDTSLLYTDPLILTSLLDVPDSISNIVNSPSWSAPSVDNFKAHIIKVASFSNGQISSNIYTKTIFVDPDTNSRYQNFDVISIVTDPENLFDYDSGIYVKGVHYSSSNTTWTGNYFQKGDLWEKPGNIELFNQEGKIQFSQNVGLRTHGGKGRNLPQKSLRIYPRNQYGAPRINYPILDTKDTRIFNRLVIRNSLSCWSKTIIKDECTGYICKELNIETLGANPVILFLNGEYWGIQSVREYFDSNFIEELYDLDDDSINVVIHGTGNHPTLPIDWGIVEGTNEGHIEMYDFLNNNDLSIPASYSYITQILDIESIIDYYCAEIYFNNKDWPTNNNKLWNFGTSGKWRQVLYDMDGAWQYLGTGYNALNRALSATGSAQNSPYATFLLRKLVESDEFVDGFVSRMACLMKNEFDSDTVVNAINLFKSKYESGMPEHIGRWHNPSSVSSWSSNINQMISFANGRKQSVISHVSSAFNIDFDPEDYDCLLGDTTTNPVDTTGTIDTVFASVTDEIAKGDFILYPNPSTDKYVWLDFTFNTHQIDYEVYDLMGRLLIKGLARNHQRVFLNFESGTYLVKVNFEDKNFIRKVILE